MTPEALSTVLGLLTLVSIVASAVAVARASLAKSTIDTLKESNAALIEQAGIMASQIARLSTEVAALAEQNEALKTLKSGKEAVERLGLSLATADDHRKGEHHDILATIQAQQAVFTRQHEEVIELIRATAHTHGAGA